MNGVSKESIEAYNPDTAVDQFVFSYQSLLQPIELEYICLNNELFS